MAAHRTGITKRGCRFEDMNGYFNMEVMCELGGHLRSGKRRIGWAGAWVPGIHESTKYRIYVHGSDGGFEGGYGMRKCET